MVEHAAKKRWAVVAALLLVCGNALAAPVCPGPADLAALRTAALQQQLMVSSFTCGDTRLYNRFVLAHRRELQTADAALMAYLKHRNPATGDADYDTLKTSFANNAALQSSGDGKDFCARAAAAFARLFGADKEAFAGLVSDQPYGAAESYAECPVPVTAPAAQMAPAPGKIIGTSLATPDASRPAPIR